jgi:hypothetical protein
MVFQYVESLVLHLPPYLPPRSTAGDDLGDVVLGDGKAGHPGHGIFDLALCVDKLEADPVDQDRILAVAQLNRLDPAIAECLFRVPPTDFLFVTVRFGAVDKVVSALWEAGLQVKMKSSPASGTILATGSQANRSSPRNTGRNDAGRAPCLADQRLTALRSQSCLSAPSFGAMNSGVRGTTLEWPGAATVADSIECIASVLPLERLGVRQCGQPFCEQKNSVPSQATRVLPPSRPKACRIGGLLCSASIRSNRAAGARGPHCRENRGCNCRRESGRCRIASDNLSGRWAFYHSALIG